MTYEKKDIAPGVWVYAENGRDYLKPEKAVSFAFDTETLTFFDGKILNVPKLRKRIRNMTEDDKRRHVSSLTWAWQAYDEINGFFMTNDFIEFLRYCCRVGYKFGHCYNATFDFSQIDYQILSDAGRWKPHKHVEKGSGKAYDKGQAWTYESLHNNMGARYAYKLWIPYRNKDRHTYVHAIEIHDFMKFLPGGLARVLEDLKVEDNDGNALRKLAMDYQAANPDALTPEEVAYCAMDVKGLYFAVKKFNDEIERQSGGELHIHGPDCNVMTAGGFAKRELLRSMYPDTNPRQRLRKYQKEHPITPAQDDFLRRNHLYRGGISFVNPRFKGRLLLASEIGRKMNRYDVNSEYPFAMSIIRDLVGKPIKKSYDEYDAMPDKEEYEAVYGLQSVVGHVRPGYLGLWYNPFKRDYVDDIDEEGLHLMFKREFDEMLNWYDGLEVEIGFVLLWRKGERVFERFVNENYELKAKAKREGNATLQACTKLKLNSSYGKLAERIERVAGHYELNADTGAVHFVSDGAETEEKTAMNVAVGALVTATARVYILSKIREVCAPAVDRTFVYIDTDSIHAFADYDKADAYALGGLKLEASCEAVKYILPKTYVDIERIGRYGAIDFKDIEVHSKGISTGAVMAELRKKQKGKRKGKPTLRLIDSKIDYGVKYYVLCAMNVPGGKVLLPVEKYIATIDRRPLYIANMSGTSYLQEI